MSEFSTSITPWKLPPLLYRTRKFEFNRYYIEQEFVKGFLKVANIPVDILKIKKDLISPNTFLPNNSNYLIGYNAIVGFVNKGTKKVPTTMPKKQKISDNSKKVDLMNYIIHEQTFEPWNEYVVQDNPPKLLRVRTVMTAAYWDPDYTTSIGDPYINVQHNTNISVSDNESSESGMT